MQHCVFRESPLRIDTQVPREQLMEERHKVFSMLTKRTTPVTENAFKKTGAEVAEEAPLPPICILNTTKDRLKLILERAENKILALEAKVEGLL